jgi:hypothetical protein
MKKEYTLSNPDAQYESAKERLQYPDLVDLFLEQFCYSSLRAGPFFVVEQRVIRPEEVDGFIAEVVNASKEEASADE